MCLIGGLCDAISHELQKIEQENILDYHRSPPLKLLAAVSPDIFLLLLDRHS